MGKAHESPTMRRLVGLSRGGGGDFGMSMDGEENGEEGDDDIFKIPTAPGRKGKPNDKEKALLLSLSASTSGSDKDSTSSTSSSNKHLPRKQTKPQPLLPSANLKRSGSGSIGGAGINSKTLFNSRREVSLGGLRRSNSVGPQAGGGKGMMLGGAGGTRKIGGPTQGLTMKEEKEKEDLNARRGKRKSLSPRSTFRFSFLFARSRRINSLSSL